MPDRQDRACLAGHEFSDLAVYGLAVCRLAVWGLAVWGLAVHCAA